MDPAMIERYAKGADLLPAAIDGLSAAEFGATPVPGTWSIQQIVIHLMDSDLIASDRIKRVIAEENPAIIAFDQAAFAKNLFYDRLDPLLAADIFRKNREMNAVILRNLPPEAFKRAGIHNERGRLTLAQFLTGCVDHLDHHLKFLREKRAMVKKPGTPA